MEAGFLRRGAMRDPLERSVEILRLLVQIARAKARVDPALATFDRQRTRAGETRGERLRATHAAQSRRQDPAAPEVTAVVPAARLDECFVRPLDDALTADVDPRSGGHLAEHHQALPVQRVEVLPRRPLRHQVGIGDQHARGIGMRAQDADGLAALDQQRLVGLEPAEAFDDRVEACPVARRLADAAIDDERIRILRDLGVQVVLDHPVRRLDQPVRAGQLRTARRADGACGMRRIDMSFMMRLEASSRKPS